MNAHPGALRLVSGGLAEAIRPVPPLPFSSWLAKNIKGLKLRREYGDANRMGELELCLAGLK